MLEGLRNQSRSKYHLYLEVSECEIWACIVYMCEVRMHIKEMCVHVNMHAGSIVYVCDIFRVFET